VLKIIALFAFFFLVEESFSQNFYSENNPKTIFFDLGLGVGTFFPAPRPNTFQVINRTKPTINLGLGKRIGNHFSLKSNFSYQGFRSFGLVVNPKGINDIGDLFSGNMISFDLMPTVNLMPTAHHLTRAKVDLNLGIGIGYIATQTKEIFSFQDLEYEFNFLAHNIFIPVRASTTYRIGNMSDVSLEGAFFVTRLDPESKLTEFKRNSNHFAQLNFVYRRYVW
jgi:hypothetical protein